MTTLTRHSLCTSPVVYRHATVLPVCLSTTAYLWDTQYGIRSPAGHGRLGVPPEAHRRARLVPHEAGSSRHSRRLRGMTMTPWIPARHPDTCPPFRSLTMCCWAGGHFFLHRKPGSTHFDPRRQRPRSAAIRRRACAEQAPAAPAAPLLFLSATPATTHSDAWTQATCR